MSLAGHLNHAFDRAVVFWKLFGLGIDPRDRMRDERLPLCSCGAPTSHTSALGSPESLAAVNVDGLPGHVRGIAAGQEGDHTGDVVGLADSSQGGECRGPLLELDEVDLKPLGGGAGHLADDEAGGNRVYV